MKFGHEFKAALDADEYPTHWLECAVSYRQLKKCVKSVQEELASLGLHRDVVAHLLPENSSSDSSLKSTGITLPTFEPTLTFLVQPNSRRPIHASLSPTTRATLSSLAHGRAPAEMPSKQRDSQLLVSPHMSRSQIDGTGCQPSLEPNPEPLSSESTFVTMVGTEAAALEALRARDELELKTEIMRLSDDIFQVAQPPGRSSTTDMYAWREIFALYTQSTVFFTTSERETHTRNASKARQQLQDFVDNLAKLGLWEKLQRQESRGVLTRFMNFNMTLLKHLRFQELNHCAIGKILKSEIPYTFN